MVSVSPSSPIIPASLRTVDLPGEDTRSPGPLAIDHRQLSPQVPSTLY